MWSIIAKKSWWQKLKKTCHNVSTLGKQWLILGSLFPVYVIWDPIHIKGESSHIKWHILCNCSQACTVGSWGTLGTIKLVIYVSNHSAVCVFYCHRFCLYFFIDILTSGSSWTMLILVQPKGVAYILYKKYICWWFKYY